MTLRNGLLAGVMAFALGGGVAAANPQTNLTVTPSNGDTSLTCSDSTACFDVSSDKNITHIFVNVDFCSVDPPYTVTVDGVDVTKLHTKGGPCNIHGQHGEDYIARTAWFPLQGNQKTAHVCVTVPGAMPGSISVGAKSAEECQDATTLGDCQECQAPPPDGGCPPPPPPPCDP